MLPGLSLLTINILHVAPAGFLLPAGHPSVTYYPFSFLHESYSDVVALYGSRQLFRHLFPYLHNVIEYPVLIGLYMSLMAWLPGFWGYFVGSAFGFAVALTAAVYLLWRGVGTRAALWMSCSPLLLVFGMLNWDLLGIVTWGLSVHSWRRGRFLWSGLYIGLGMATKFFPVVLLPYFLASLGRQTNRRGQRAMGLGFLVTGVGMNLPFVLWAEPGWSEFFTYNSGRGPVPGIYQWLCSAGLWQISAVNMVSALLTAAGGLALLAAVWRRRLAAVEAATTALAWWFLCNKVYSPQYMLWIYYALLWVEVNGPLLLVMNAAGLLDFDLAMRWLALGTTGNPDITAFGRTFPPPIIALRDLTLLAAVSVTTARKRVRSYLTQKTWG